MSDVIIPEGDFVEIVKPISTLLVIVLLTSKGVQN